MGALGFSVTWVGVLESGAALLGLFYVILLARGDGRGWSLGVAAACLAVCIYYQRGLWGQVALNFVFLGLQLWGWWAWIKAKGSDLRKQCRRLKHREGFVVAVIWVLGTGLGKSLLTLWGGQMVLLDALTTSGSLLGQVLLVLGVVEAWLLYLVCDILLVILNLRVGLDFYALMYVAYCGFAWMGLRSWTRDLKTGERKALPPVA